jgi:hypothetical protein
MGTGVTDIPNSPAGEHLRWWLGAIDDPGRLTAADVIGRYARVAPKSPWLESDDAGRASWQQHWHDFGGFAIEAIDAASPFEVSIVLDPTTNPNRKRQRVTFVVEEEPPHRVLVERWSRVYDFDLEIRPATQDDAPTLTSIERRAEVVLGDTKVVTDRGEDYFAAARLLDDATVFLATVDGDPAAVGWGAQAPARLNGTDVTATYFFHLRVSPDHQRQGLWGALDGAVWTAYGETSDVYIGYWLAENTAWAHVAEQVQARPDFVRRDWVPTVYRLLLPTASMAGAAGDRPRAATAADAGRIVEILNAFHAGEELYCPYTEASLTARLERDRSYTWEHLLVTDRAVLGIWRAGDTIQVLTDSAGISTVNRRGHVLDYGFVADEEGAEADFAELLAAACGDLDRRGIDQLSIFTSRGARGQALLKRFKGSVEAYRFNTGAAAQIPDDAQRTGIYTDHLYF